MAEGEDELMVKLESYPMAQIGRMFLFVLKDMSQGPEWTRFKEAVESYMQKFPPEE